MLSFIFVQRSAVHGGNISDTSVTRLRRYSRRRNFKFAQQNAVLLSLSAAICRADEQTHTVIAQRSEVQLWRWSRNKQVLHNAYYQHTGTINTLPTNLLRQAFHKRHSFNWSDVLQNTQKIKTYTEFAVRKLAVRVSTELLSVVLLVFLVKAQSLLTRSSCKINQI
jgi:hypothetical protein